MDGLRHATSASYGARVEFRRDIRVLARSAPPPKSAPYRGTRLVGRGASSDRILLYNHSTRTPESYRCQRSVHVDRGYVLGSNACMADRMLQLWTQDLWEFYVFLEPQMLELRSFAEG